MIYPKILNMENEICQKDNPWNNLSTITIFDKGNNLYSSKCIGRSGKRKNSNKVLKKISSTSILIDSLINQLCMLLEKDQVHRKRLYFLLYNTMHQMKLIDPYSKDGGYELIQGKYNDAMYRLINVARTTFGSDSSVPISRPLKTYNSPYQENFQETGYIAGGGFGHVFKAIHKLDKVEYAIKKIIVRSGKVNTIMNHLKEVRTLAKLNHNNIVSYKQAWIEPMLSFCMPELPSNTKEETEISIENSLNSSITNSLNEFNISNDAKYKSKKTFTFVNECESLSSSDNSNNKQILKTDDSNSDIVSFRNENYMSTNNGACSSIVKINSSRDESNSSNDSTEDNNMCQYSSKRNQYAILYIQMTLCEKTLRHWLDERIESTPVSIIASIATQILCGLSYIHSLTIVHHDIKPSNIFISTSGKLQIQLGDFGLACPLQRDYHDIIVGTCMYAAPEQLKGECNPKSDVYSLGIVLLELLIPMQTSMECIQTIEMLKAGELPEILTASYPKWANRISQLIQKNPIKRPTSYELLEDLKLDKDLTITKLQEENSKLHNENIILKNNNKTKDQIIEDQKIKIQELMAKLSKLELNLK